MNELASSIDCTDTVLHFLNTVEESNHLDYGYLKDVLTDVNDLLLPERSTVGAAYDGLPINIKAATYPSSSSSSASGPLIYPVSEPTGASVMSLPDPEVKSSDPFMDMLAASYNATRRDIDKRGTKTPGVNSNESPSKSKFQRPSLSFSSPSSSTNRITRRINLVDHKDRIIILEFTNEHDYWRLIRAIKRTLKDENCSIVYICRSSWPRAEVPSANTPIRSPDGSSSSASSSLSTPPVMHTCQVVGGEIRYKSGSDDETIDLRSMKALTVSWDYIPVSKYVLKTSFSLAGTLEKLTAIVKRKDSAESSMTNVDELRIGESCTMQLHSDEDLRSIQLDVEVCDKGTPFGQATMEPTAGYDLRIAEQGGNPFLVPFLCRIPLEIPMSMRAVRVIIHSAEGLVSSRPNKPPSAYASVYLLGDQEQYYLTAKTKETKTIVINSTPDPVWEQEFILHGPRGLEGATALRVKVKDQGSGYFGDNNLGQVTIPSTCFVPETVATLTLPVEPAASMTVNKNDYGEVKVSTELVVMSQLLEPLLSKRGLEEMDIFKRGASPKILPRETISSVGEGHVFCTVHRTGEYDVWWWPCKIADPAKEFSCISGHLFCRYDACYIYIDAKQAQKSDADSIIAKDFWGNNDEMNKNGKTLRVPWMKILSIDMLTVSTAQMTLECSSEYGFASCVDRREVDILIAPCPASGLAHLVRDRISVSHLRSELKSFLSTVMATKEESESQRADRQTNGAWSDEVILSVARSVLGSIAHGILSFRAKMYFAQLLEGCRELRSGRPDHGSIKSTVHNDLLRAEEGVKHYAEDGESAIRKTKQMAPISVIIERIRVLVDYAIVQLRNFILFSAGPVRSSKTHFSVEEGNVSSNMAGNKTLVIELVREYHVRIKEMLDRFISDVEVFRSIDGQNDKTCVVKFLIKENHIFNSAVVPLLRCMDVNLEKPSLLVDEQRLDEILDWYTQTISSETKSWLAKTIANAWASKQNKFDLPWDVIEINSSGEEVSKFWSGLLRSGKGLYVSSIPETYRYQMNVYLDLCSERPQPRYNGYKVDTDEVNRVLQMNNKILKAIAGALCLLAEEYKVALQSKHWSTVSESNKIKEEEASAQLHFLVSVINDSHRLSTVHLQPLKDVETHSISIHELTKSVTTVFDGVIDTAINHIVRTMFSDLNAALVNFENLWQEERAKGGTNGAPLTIITTTLSDYFNGLFGTIETKYFATIVTMCLDTCVMRYLIFLRDFSARSNKEVVSKKDVSKFAIDCANLKTCFLCPALPLDVTLRDVLNQKLTSVTNLVDLITQDYEGEHCQEIIHDIAKKYNGQYKSIGANVLAITSALRPEDVGESVGKSKLEYQALVGSILDQYENQDFVTEYIVNMEYGEAKVTKNTGGAENAGYLPPSDFYLRLFPDKNNENSKTDTCTSVDTTKTPGSTIKNSKQLLSSATKALRENVSDMNVFSAFSKRAKAKQRATKSQDKLLELQRELGLGGNELRSNHDNGSTSDHQHVSVDGVSHDPDGESEVTGVETSSLAGVQTELFAGMDSLPFNEQCVVCIEQIKVRNIKSSSLLGKSNAYVAFTLGSTRIKTSVIWGTNSPVWDTKALGPNFYFYAPRESLHQLKMSVKVFDKERIRRKRLLGSVAIGLSTLNLRPIESFFAMEAGESGSTSKAAEIFVRVTLKDR